MPAYTMKNTETDEIVEMILSISEREKFLQDNTTWIQTLTTPPIVSGVKSNLSRTDGGWKEILHKVKKGSGRGNTIKT